MSDEDAGYVQGACLELEQYAERYTPAILRKTPAEMQADARLLAVDYVASYRAGRYGYARWTLNTIVHYRRIAVLLTRVHQQAPDLVLI